MTRPFVIVCLLLSACAKPPEDVRKSHLVGPGFRYIYTHQPRLQRVTHVFEIRFKNDWEIASLIAGRGLRSTATLSELVGRTPAVAAVNGDFFSQEGLPSGIQISNGRLVKNPAPSWLAFGVDWQDRFFIDSLSCLGEIIINQFTSIIVDGFNRSRQSDETILYNTFYGDRTNTNAYGIEVTLRIAARHATVGDTVKAIVVAVDSTVGNSPIADSTLVLSSHGNRDGRLMRRMFIGQIVDVAMTSSRGRVKEAIGGFPALVHTGSNVINPARNTGEFFSGLTARTAVGLSDSAIYIVGVDKITPVTSIGMSLYELAEFMISLGCTEALNLDGGGSTTFWLNSEIINRPSEGEERKIANALVVRKR